MTSPYEHTEYMAQLSGIREMPDDDLRRLVLADWLEEHGEAERAAFIRHQINFRFNGQLVAHTGDVLSAKEKGLGIFYGIEPSAVTFRRGFVADICCTLTDWLAEGPKLVREHPIELVVLTDREPRPFGTVAIIGSVPNVGHWSHVWYDSGEGELSRPWSLRKVARHLSVRPNNVGWHLYQSREEAMADLSAALIAWAKSQSRPIRTSP